MPGYFSRSVSLTKQFVWGIALILAVAGVCFLLTDYIGYRATALLLLVVVSAEAMFFAIWPVVTAAVLSALIWNFFFIPPRYTFEISSAEDWLLFLMYFVIALLNAVLTFKLREFEKQIKLREEKENTLRLYNTLLNSLSHELRTPIATILAATDNLEENGSKLNDAHKDELLHEISKASLRLNRQVENLLNVSRLESGMLRLKTDWCDIGELVYNVKSNLAEHTTRHEVKIDLPAQLPLFRLDYGLMEQVLFNLLLNAATYTPESSVITVRVSCPDDVLQIDVEDQGPGFSEEALPHIFEKFYRPKNSPSGGTGLGLSIVKGFTEAHGGKVKLENILPHGARFTLVLPVEVSYLQNLKHE